MNELLEVAVAVAVACTVGGVFLKIVIDIMRREKR